MAYAVAVNDSPLKGSSPVPVNAIVTAQDHMSAAVVTRTPASCSGAMNAGVPTATCPESPVVVMPGTAARPKSITTGPSGPRRTLPGLKSRCTMPTACTAPSAVSVATAIRSSTAPVRGPRCWMTSTSEGPLTYSLTMNGRRSKIPASRTCAVQNPATCCAAATSFRKRFRTSGSVVGASSLTAARHPVRPRARKTTPCPPSPRRPSSWYPPTSRGSVSRSGSIPDVADPADVTKPFCPGGCSVSNLTLGTWTFGAEAGELDAHRQLDQFLSAGGTLVDTADVYGSGASEQIVGRWLASRPADVTQRVVLATKGRFPMGDSPN